MQIIFCAKNYDEADKNIVSALNNSKDDITGKSFFEIGNMYYKVSRYDKAINCYS